MDENSFEKIARFIAQESGIQIAPNKAYMMEARLQPILAQFDISSFEHLALQLITATVDLRQAVVDAMTTNESFFFRDQNPFELFSGLMLPQLVEQKRLNGQPLRIWCAAVATGQEAYSLAIAILENAQLLEGINVKILGTDISSEALQIAKKGTYTQFEAQRGLSSHRLIQYFDQEGSSWRAQQKLRDMVEFRRFNLLDSFADIGPMDIVFCRNVLIYFDVETKNHVLHKIRKIINPRGYLMLGAAETLIGISDEFEPAQNNQNILQPV